MNFPNIYSLFREQAAKYRGEPVFYSRENGVWVTENWEIFESKVHDFACALSAMNFTHGASVAILAGNIKEWVVCDIGTIAANGVGVGLYPTSSPEQCAYIINHSDAEFVVVDTKAQLEKIAGIRSELLKVKAIIVIDETCADENQAIYSFNEFLKFGANVRNDILPRIVETALSANVENTAIMVYTSGTTGKPKGACLSHRYVLKSVESLRRTIPIFDTDVSFSYLPFCHVAERISGLYNRLYCGSSVHFVDDLAKLGAYMLEVKPTVFASLPRFFEKIYARVISDCGSKDVDAQTLKDYFGGRIRLATSGGAPLPNHVAKFFADANLPILQAYGLTENICTAFNRADDFKFGTVGKPMPMCEIKTASDGEILVKSPMMFSGYHKDAAKTDEMFDANGWLLTGDLGKIDDDGFLTITGRKKEIIVLSNGKNVAPALLENLLKENHLVSQAFIYGDGKSYLVAIITLNQLEAEVYARTRNIEFSNFAELTQKPEIQSLITEIVATTNARVSSSEAIKRYEILERDFQADSDEITPTMKLKRNVISENFKGRLEDLYQ